MMFKCSLFTATFVVRPIGSLLPFAVMKHVHMFMRLGSGVEVRVHVKAFHPKVPSYLRNQPAFFFRRHELEKKQEYGERVRSAECGSFTPLFFLTFSGLRKEAIYCFFYSRVADLLSKKHKAWYMHCPYCIAPSSFVLYCVLLSLPQG